MFGFGRSGKRAALAKELAEMRFRLRGQDNVEARLMIKSLGSFQAMGLPEGAIVSIVEVALTNQNKGVLLKDTLINLERLRQLKCSDPERFKAILIQSTGSNPAEALLEYIHYRIEIEAPNSYGILSYEELMHLIPIAYETISSW